MLSVLIVIAVAPFVYRGFKEQALASAQLKRQHAAFERWIEVDKECDRHFHLFEEARDNGRHAEAEWHRQICLRLRDEEESARARWRDTWDDAA